MPKILTHWSLIFLLGACYGPGQVRPDDPEAGAYFQPLTPKQLGARGTSEQKIEANYGDRNATFLSAIEISPEKMTMVAAAATGQRLFTIYLSDQGKLDFDPGVLNDGRIKPEYIVADFQLIFWPAPVIKDALRGSGFILSLRDAPKIRRELLLDGRLIVEIEYSDKNPWRGGITFKNLERNYGFMITNGSTTIR
jgi:Protein of unknown function (DUF3261)